MSECNDTYVETGGPDAILVTVPRPTQILGEWEIGRRNALWGEEEDINYSKLRFGCAIQDFYAA